MRVISPNAVFMTVAYRYSRSDFEKFLERIDFGRVELPENLIGLEVEIPK